MSERYNVQASDVLGENYKIISVECSDYNPSIDSTITVTISVNDVYGDAVSGESVTVVAGEGTFTQLNGSDITASDSVTGTTNSSGQFTLTYTCSEWGLITFVANNSTTQIHVDGWRLLSGYTEQSSFRLYRNKTHAKMILEEWGQSITFTSTWTQMGSSAYVTTIKPQGYVVGINNWGNVFFRINPDGHIAYRAISSNVSNTKNWMQLEWAIQE